MFDRAARVDHWTNNWPEKLNSDEVTGLVDLEEIDHVMYELGSELGRMDPSLFGKPVLETLRGLLEKLQASRDA